MGTGVSDDQTEEETREHRDEVIENVREATESILQQKCGLPDKVVWRPMEKAPTCEACNSLPLPWFNWRRRVTGVETLKEGSTARIVGCNITLWHSLINSPLGDQTDPSKIEQSHATQQIDKMDPTLDHISYSSLDNILAGSSHFPYPTNSSLSMPGVKGISPA